ncbi:protein of unknown function [Nitrospira japonica]|uniref:Uncharacterized protein n=1 Tax=Nitrospira japonica TaxID=1325564 RepID=A0A1W1I222_9BACT|nr:protein of unknown function [Nitrospira japonica]
MAVRLPRIRLKSVDLPTFGRPMMATSGIGDIRELSVGCDDMEIRRMQATRTLTQEFSQRQQPPLSDATVAGRFPARPRLYSGRWTRFHRPRRHRGLIGPRSTTSWSTWTEPCWIVTSTISFSRKNYPAGTRCASDCPSENRGRD